MRWILALVALLSASANELAAQGKGIRLWNLTTATISEFQLSPAGKSDWGPNQTLNDKDKEVDHDERLRITGVREALLRSRHRDQGRRRVFDRGQGFKGLQQVAATAFPPTIAQPADHTASWNAFWLLRGYSQRHFTAVHFGCSPIHCAM